MHLVNQNRASNSPFNRYYMKSKTRNLSSLINVEGREFAMYTIEERALPSMIDGLKPVNRYILYSVLHNAHKEFKKNASVAGVISDYGYNHGEDAALNAAKLMASTWSNNYPIILGRGNFGSRVVHDGASARYIFCMKHDNFDSMFKDNDLLENSDKHGSDLPKYYIPTVPYVLLNGISGIATGFSTDILPHSLESVVACVKQYIDTGKCDEPEIKFPSFHGKITKTDTSQWRLEGTYELSGKTKLTITEIPVKYDRVKYVTLLDKLVDSGKIVDYNESKNVGTDFCFKVTLKRDFDTGHESIMKTFGLYQSVSQNINVIDEYGKLKSYNCASDLIIDFVEFRKKILLKRIDNAIIQSQSKLDYANARVSFIKLVLDNKIVFNGNTKSQVIAQIENHDDIKKYSTDLVQMNLYHMTQDEVIKLEKYATELAKHNEYWHKTTTQQQYKLDLKELL